MMITVTKDDDHEDHDIIMHLFCNIILFLDELDMYLSWVK
jgi:hypothetical protein